MEWSKEQIKSLQARQKSSQFHPYTCVCGAGTLEVSKDGLYCPKCGYTQTRVYESDLNWGWKEMLQWDIDEDGKIILY